MYLESRGCGWGCWLAGKERGKGMKRFAAGLTAVLLVTGNVRAEALDEEAIAQEEESPAVAVELAVDVYSAYVWRGITYNDGFVVQPSLDVELPNGFGVNVWANYDLDDYNNQIDKDEFSELDVTVRYTLPVDFAEIVLGVVQYTFPQAGGPDDSDTIEWFASASYDVLEGLSCGLEVAYDSDQVKDLYAKVSLTYEMDLMDGLGGELSASAGYAGDEWSASGDPGFFDYSFGVALAYSITDSASLGASAVWVGALDDDVLADVDERFFYGCNLACGF